MSIPTIFLSALVTSLFLPVFANTTSTSSNNSTVTPNVTTPVAVTNLTTNVTVNSTISTVVTTPFTSTSTDEGSGDETATPSSNNSSDECEAQKWIDLLYNTTVNLTGCVLNQTWLERPHISYCDKYDVPWMVLGRDDRPLPSGKTVPLAYEGLCCVIEGQANFVFLIRHWYGGMTHHNALRVDYNCSWHTRLMPIYPMLTNFSIMAENYMATMRKHRGTSPCKGKRVYYYGLQHPDEIGFDALGHVELRIKETTFPWPKKQTSGPFEAPDKDDTPLLVYVTEFIILCGLASLFLYLILKAISGYNGIWSNFRSPQKPWEPPTRRKKRFNKR
ncbi:membrane protein A32 [Saimiriine betaherpesvirus 4]|uniref:Membrane protein A32 n=1 Tax=Saimiriine betaherpesvirus 4 TaxID=1535247 RepID=G8XT41_9BETA|nr:membrane protein A32 [Saimiriine betaherpesvirus 4]AEV80983.1 membrane protein A32 [Saimiriine betaherpesvirus 4]